MDLAELRASKFTKFPLRYENQCASCGKKLPVGQSVYGTKVDRRWMFMCDDCYGKMMDMAIEEGIEAMGDIVDAIAKASDSSDAEAAELMGMIENDPSDAGFIKAPEPREKMELKKSVLQLIKENAQWRI